MAKDRSLSFCSQKKERGMGENLQPSWELDLSVTRLANFSDYLSLISCLQDARARERALMFFELAAE
jgi:hypothetical protein